MRKEKSIFQIPLSTDWKFSKSDFDVGCLTLKFMDPSAMSYPQPMTRVQKWKLRRQFSFSYDLEQIKIKLMNKRRQENMKYNFHNIRERSK